uniref:Uncharacterized protein n=1 Tax=Setaria digitata TaxID=48799 RepID=A0A915Q794_9BILA
MSNQYVSLQAGSLATRIRILQLQLITRVTYLTYFETYKRKQRLVGGICGEGVVGGVFSIFIITLRRISKDPLGTVLLTWRGSPGCEM